MTDSEAIDIAQGYTETEDLETYTMAWQHLIDTGLAWCLQGWFGRMAMRMVRGGYCTLPVAHSQHSSENISDKSSSICEDEPKS